MENEVIKHYAGQVLSCLELNEQLPDISEPLLQCSQHLIYPSVAKVLGLGWDVL